MRMVATFTVVLWLVASFTLAGDSAEKLTFKKAGFSIAPLDEPQKGPAQVLMIYLPASDGFAPNVNVQIQPYVDDMDAYVALSLTQFKDAGLKVLSESKANKLVATFEYSGPFKGMSLHWYAKAVQKDGAIYLTTATATEDQWAKVVVKLKACVDSFETSTSELNHTVDGNTRTR
jgi:hypothetical protein